ncbi:TPA: amino acid permease [Bacillus cereus biovar anthracis]|nr:amino acid permease [Bacillus paranthracis]HDR4492274.1 amino acid permease [Bacillus cereus biovar anthracis]HDR6228189.1 amino acid permease [Bacillus cereus biovar anthracis]HDR6232293.1 amino acid permease [Bacillus cereus biovar anthracis]HDR6238391.1 amino acid permease [Bacillus cereus biovar anthracis]
MLLTSLLERFCELLFTFVSLVFIPDQRIALYYGIPFMVICCILYQMKYKKIVTFEQQRTISKGIN